MKPLADCVLMNQDVVTTSEISNRLSELDWVKGETISREVRN